MAQTNGHELPEAAELTFPSGGVATPCTLRTLCASPSMVRPDGRESRRGKLFFRSSPGAGPDGHFVAAATATAVAVERCRSPVRRKPVQSQGAGVKAFFTWHVASLNPSCPNPTVQALGHSAPSGAVRRRRQEVHPGPGVTLRWRLGQDEPLY